MHLLLLPGLIVALAGGALGGRPVEAPVSPPSGLVAPILFSFQAQASGTPTTTVGSAATPTEVIAGTASVTSTVPVASTPIPLPTTAPSNLQLNPFDPAFLFSPPSSGALMGPFAWLYLLIMVALLGASVYFLVVRRPQWKRTNTVLYRATNLWGQVGAWIGGIGLIFLLFRVIQLDLFNLRIWMYLCMLALVVAVGWFIYWYRTTYPKEVARYQKLQRARQYMPAGAKGAARLPAGASTRAPANQPSNKAGTNKQGSQPARPGAGSSQARKKKK